MNSPELEVVEASAKNAATFVNNEVQSKLKRSKSAGEQLSELLEPSREALKRDRQAAERIVALRKAQEAAAGIKSERRASSPKQLAALQSLVSLQPGINSSRLLGISTFTIRILQTSPTNLLTETCFRK
jgi:hypothetical protein